MMRYPRPAATARHSSKHWWQHCKWVRLFAHFRTAFFRRDLRHAAIARLSHKHCSPIHKHAFQETQALLPLLAFLSGCWSHCKFAAIAAIALANVFTQKGTPSLMHTHFAKHHTLDQFSVQKASYGLTCSLMFSPVLHLAYSAAVSGSLILPERLNKLSFKTPCFAIDNPG